MGYRLSLGGTTGYAINPARLGAAYHACNLTCKGVATGLACSVVGPIVGAAIAAGLHMALQ
jgi:glycerol uptake facilitator-like aquaporin